MGRVLLIQHILQSITIYHMTYIETPIGTTKHIKRLFKDFVWGTSDDGSTWKVPLISCERLTQPRDKGGLGFKDALPTHTLSLVSGYPNLWMIHLQNGSLSS